MIVRLVANKSNSRYPAENDRLLTNADFIEEIKKKTLDGSVALSAARGRMDLLEKLAAAGKIEILA